MTILINRSKVNEGKKKKKKKKMKKKKARRTQSTLYWAPSKSPLKEE